MPVTEVSDPTLAGARLNRLRTNLTRAPYDALVLTSPEAVCYATGYRSVAGQIFAGHAMAAVVTEERVWLVCPAADTAAAIDAGVSADAIVPYGRFYFTGDEPAAAMSDRHASFRDALVAALRPVRGRFGAEGPAAALVAELVPAQDVTGWMLGVRSVKLPEELDRLRTAAGLAEDGIEAALAGAGAGVTERELAVAVAAAMVAGGAEPRFVVVTAGPRSGLADAFASARPCRAGDLLRLDVGCVYDGYWSDIARTAVLGEPGDRQQKVYDALLAGLRAELATAAPGVTSGEVFDAARGGVESAGLRPYLRHHAGHAIGLSVYERPVVAPDTEVELVPGMVLCLETPYYQPGWGGLMVEDTGVVTDTGFELFTHIDRTLRVVPA